MDGDPDCFRLIHQSSRNGLPDPPRCIRAEFKPFFVVVLIDCFHHADIAFLDQVEQRKPSPYIMFRDIDDQPQIADY